MKILKNFFGNNTKIHIDNIIGGTKDNPMKVGQPLNSASNTDLIVWLFENIEPNTYGAFYPAYTATNLPAQIEIWRYSAGFYLRRTENVFHIVLIARNGQIATIVYHNQQYSWKIFT